MADIRVFNGKLVGNKAEFQIGRFSGGYLYISYQKGNESTLRLSFQVKDSKHPRPQKSFYIISNGEKYQVDLVQNIDQIIPIPLPESADILEVLLETVGAPLDNTNPVSIEVFFNGDLNFM